MSVQTASLRRQRDSLDTLGPVICQQCRKLVRWVRIDGVLRLVNAGTGTFHVCLR